MKRKLVYLFLAIALIITSSITYALRGTRTVARAGIGVNEKVDNVDDVFEVMNSALYALDVYGTDDNSKYQSATIHINMSEKTKYSYGAHSQSASYLPPSSAGGNGKEFAEQDITCYVASNGVYIESKGHIHLNTSSDNTSIFEQEQSLTKVFVQYNVNIFLANDKCYIKINSYNYLCDSVSKMIKPEYANEWLEASYEIISTLFLLNTETQIVLGALVEKYELLVEEGIIDKNDTKVSLNKDDVSAVMEPIYDPFYNIIDDYKVEVKMDLTDSTRPYVSISSGYDFKYYYEFDKNSSEGCEIKTKSVMDVVVFNINNTVINENFFNFIPTVQVDSIDAFESLLMMEEYKEADDE